MDVYNSTTGVWSTARLSVARDRIAATSVRNVALFAGGYVQGGLMYLWWGLQLAATAEVLCFFPLPAPACFSTQFIADNYASLDAVDVFNSATGVWSTAQLSMRRRALGATSVGNVALFAGGGVSDGTFVAV